MIPTRRGVLAFFIVGICCIGIPSLVFIVQHPAVDMAASPAVGRRFLPLISYLQGTEAAGFVTDAEPASSHPDTRIPIMLPFQQAQYVLSPVYLDHIHPDRYCSVVAYYSDEHKLERMAQLLHARIDKRFPNGVALLRRYHVNCSDHL